MTTQVVQGEYGWYSVAGDDKLASFPIANGPGRGALNALQIQLKFEAQMVLLIR